MELKPKAIGFWRTKVEAIPAMIPIIYLIPNLENFNIKKNRII